jgi:hypothetical protein
MTKRIEWAYPTSDNAERFGFKDGCYTVEMVERTPEQQPAIAVAAFATLAEAKDHAHKIGAAWDRITK